MLRKFYQTAIVLSLIAIVIVAVHVHRDNYRAGLEAAKTGDLRSRTAPTSGARSVSAVSPNASDESPRATDVDEATVVQQDGTPAVATNADLESRYLLINQNSAYPQFADRLAAIRERRSRHELSDDQVLNALESDSSWKPTEAAPVRREFAHIDEEMLSDGREFIEYEPTRVEAALPGDVIGFSLPHRRELKLRIENIEQFEDTVRWTGVFVDYGDDVLNSFSLSQTLAGNYTNAHFTTPEGSYYMEVKNRLGWINDQVRGLVLPADGVDTLHFSE